MKFRHAAVRPRGAVTRYGHERLLNRGQAAEIAHAAAVRVLFNSLVIQAIEAVINKVEFAPCKFCGRPMSLSDSRKGKLFCGDSCRVQEYRRRKNTAIAMRENGCKLRDISVATNTPIKQVKLWIGG